MPGPEHYPPIAEKRGAIYPLHLRKNTWPYAQSNRFTEAVSAEGPRRPSLLPVMPLGVLEPR
jgi:hypothetical protein